MDRAYRRISIVVGTKNLFDASGLFLKLKDAARRLVDAILVRRILGSKFFQEKVLDSVIKSIATESFVIANSKDLNLSICHIPAVFAFFDSDLTESHQGCDSVSGAHVVDHMGLRLCRKFTGHGIIQGNCASIIDKSQNINFGNFPRI